MNQLRCYNDGEFIELEDFYNSKTMRLKAYIIKNNSKSKMNRYSLYIIGKTIFDNNCEIKFPDDSPNIDTTNTNIEKFCKKLPTPEDLINYYNRNKKSILKKFLEQYSALREKYLSTIKHYKITDFLSLAKVKCEKCGYFAIRFDEDNHYIRSKECPECYNKSYFKIEKNPTIQKTEILKGEIQE